jgi:hypothetical protein
MKLTAQLAQALVNLRSNSDFQLFVSALSDDGEQLVENLVMGPSDNELNVRRGQARQSTLILKAIAEAPKKLDEFKAQSMKLRGHQ